LVNGNILEGIFQKGKIGTYATLIYTSGALYRGEIEDFLPNGNGEMQNADQTSYVGGWKDGKRHGEGTIIDKEGNESTL